MLIIRKVILLLFLATVAACGKDSAPVLRLGTNVWPGYEPLYLARHRGDLDEHKIRLVEFSSNSQSMQAFRNRLIDAAALTLDEALLLLESGEKLTIVLVMDISHGGDAIVGRKNIGKMADLKGRRIGLENNALGAYVITRALEITGLDKNAVTLVQVDINEQEKAFLAGKVDAVVTFDPVRSKLLSRGGSVLFDSRQIPGEIVDVLVVRNSYLEKYPGIIRYLLEGWHKTLDYKKLKPRQAAAVLGQRMKLNIEDTLGAYQGLVLPGRQHNRNMLKPDSPVLLSPARKMARLMLENGLLKKAVKPELLFRKTGLLY